jgi:hypothetical protein
MPRRKLVIYFFTFLAALGLAMYLLLPAESELRTLGIILLIFWLPMALRHLSRYARERALPRFPADTMAQALLHDTVIGAVKVASTNAPASTA